MQRILQRRLLSTSQSYASTASRELALPIAFLSSAKWSGEPSSRWSSWIQKANAFGYSCHAIDVDHPSRSLEGLEKELSEQIRQSSTPFPPLLCAYGFGGLIAQTYVSSHPLSGLVLVDPPSSIAEASQLKPDLGLEKVDEFTYEPYFPIAILSSRARLESLRRHRLLQDYEDEVSHMMTESSDPLDDDNGFELFKNWMDEHGL